MFLYVEGAYNIGDEEASPIAVENQKPADEGQHP